MKNRKWHRAVAFVASAAMLLNTGGMQTLLQEIGAVVRAEELNSEIILDEEDANQEVWTAEATDSDGTEDVIVQEIDVWSSYEEPEIVVETVEVLSGSEAEQVAEESGLGDISAQADLLQEAEVCPMHVYVRLTECIDGQAAKSDSTGQGQVQWIHVYAEDLNRVSTGEATVRIYLTDCETNTPAEEVEVFLFEEWTAALPDTIVLPPVVLEDVLNGNEDLRVARQQEYEMDEDGEYVKDVAGKKIMTADYLEFILPAGGWAEFDAALIYRTGEAEYEYSVSAYADAMQVTDAGKEGVLYDGYTDKENDNELTVTWAPQESIEEQTDTAKEETTEEMTTEPSEIAVEVMTEEETAVEMTEESSETAEEPTEEETAEGMTEESAEETAGELTEETAELPAETTEAGSEAENETQLESELSSESESETELESELNSELENETELERGSESETIPEDIPVSSIRVIMTKELEETEASETEEEPVILSEEEESAADEILSEEVDSSLTEETASESESTEEADDTAVSGQTYIVHVQAEDIQPEARYDSAVSIHLTDFMTGLPASDVTTTVCQNKEDMKTAESIGSSTLTGVVQTAGGTADLTVNRIQEKSVAEDGIEIVTDDYLSFELPAGSAADFYIGFTYATEADSYEKQLMIEVKAVQYIPVQETQLQTEMTAASEKDAAFDESAEIDISPEEQEADSLKTTDSNNLDFLSCRAEGATKELTDPAQVKNSDQELLPTATLEENEGLDVKTQSADYETALAGAEEGSTTGSENIAATENTVSENPGSEDTGTTEGDGGSDSKGVVAVDVLESQTQEIMLWSARSSGTEVTVYFAVPSGWSDTKYTIKANAHVGNEANDAWHPKSMTDTGAVYNGQKVYTVTFSSSECPYDGFAELQFQVYEGDTWKAQWDSLRTIYSGSDNNWAYATSFNQKLYDPVNDKWVDYTPFDPDDHDFFAGKMMYFENRGSADLSGGVTAFFYEKLSDESLSSLQKVEEIQMSSAGSDGITYSVMIPSNACSYVQFTDSAGNILGDTYSNFYGQGESETGVESFIYDEESMYSYHYESTAENSTWGILSGKTVYYDAALSKLSYSGTDTFNENSGKSMPYSDSDMMYCYITKSDGSGGQAVTMSKVSSYTSGSNIWKDVWQADLPGGYTRIRFTAWENPSNENTAANGDGTAMMTVPTNLSKPCFYGDTSDDVIYNGGNRGGYWAEVYTIRQAESGKNTDIVDINSSAFTRKSDVLYVDSTFYDYYTDYELNGYNRDSYSGTNGASQRNWVNFRQFNQALSDYYQAAGVSIPIYTGHFQPSIAGWGNWFADVAGTLNLYGYSNYNNFFSTNNSTLDYNGNGKKYAYAAQGLVNSSLSGGLPTAKKSSVIEPHFNESFLLGNNSKNAVLGEVYHNVAFPFTKKDIDNNGVEYWWFDSAVTTLAMRNDTNGSGYYLENTGNKDWSQNVNSNGDLSGTDEVSTTYGFFPFNEATTAVSGKNYNYGFGTKLEFKFRLTEDGTVQDKNGNPVAITFNFSGDDDVWVFIDGELALDVGGAHGRVTGSLNFADKKATVSNVKASAGSSASGSNVTSAFTLEGANSDEHTLTMFYMERGMWESNMMINFNFPDENQLEVEKQVDKAEVNSLFSSLFDDTSLFTFSIKNLATHFGTKKVTGETVKATAFNVSSASPASTGNICRTGTYQGENAVYWYAQYEDKSGIYRNKRYGVMNGNTIDISNMTYLEFKYYYDYPDNPSLSNMYLQLVDTNGNVKGNFTDYLSGKTYGSVTMAGKKWVTVKIDLNKLAEESGFNNQVNCIKFGYNYPRNIYLADFVFHPSVEVQGLTGFITQQYEIPDYGSASSGNLEIPVGAKYTSSNGKNYAIGEDGTFVLQNNETIIFRDQFRRGSYIYLKEEADSRLFDTTWTMYENGEPVASMGTGETVANGNKTDLVDENSLIVDDERTEKHVTGTEDGKTIENAYSGTRPSEGAFVFRSFGAPDNTTGAAKLKLIFTNRVKTGSLTIKKEKAYETDELNGTYDFTITFTNVGGLGLENAPVEVAVSLKEGEEKTITGIPLGTDFTIKETAPEDGSSLDSVAVTGNAIVDSETKAVSGTVDDGTAAVTAAFKNTKKPLIDISMEKLWKNSDGSELTNVPSSIRIQLQRKQSTESDDKYVAVESYEDLTLSPGYDGWTYSFNGLDQYVDYTQDTKVAWDYRVVELSSDGTVVEAGGTTDNYVVTYGRTVKTDTTTEEVVGLTCTITNTYTPVSLKLEKVRASDTTKRLNGAEFTLEKLQEASGGAITIGSVQYEVDESFSKLSGTTAGTATDSEGAAVDAGQIDFGTLDPGTYRLTETKAPSGYNLLKEAILIELCADGSCTLAGSSESIGSTDMQNGVHVVTIQVANQAKFEIPATGSWSRYIISFGGMMLTGAALIMYLLQKRRKEGKAS